MNKTILLLIAVLLMMIPVAIAPIWYGSGDDTGLVGRWSCENDFKDSSGQGNHGTQSGGVTITRGAKGRACGFDGGNDLINISDSNSLDVSNMTISAWVKVANLNSYRMIVTKAVGTGSASSNFELRLQVGTGKVEFVGNGGIGTISTNSLTMNQWYHVVGTFNGTHAAAYINGVLDGTPVSTTITTNSRPVYIGERDDLSAYGNYKFNGSIDEVRIYNRSLSATEISALYNSTQTYHIQMKTTPERGIANETGLVGYWKMNKEDGSNSTRAIDSSGQGNTGIVARGITFTNEGRFKEAYRFNGTTAITTGVTGMSTANGTFSVWLKPSWASTTSLANLYVGGMRYDGNEQILMIYDTVTDRFDIAKAPNDAWVYAYCPSVAFPENTWMNMVITWSDTAGMYCYYNGASGTVNTNTIAVPNMGTNWYIGGNPGGAGFFNGTMDEVRIYNRSLSATEVAQLYNGSKTNYITLKTIPNLGGLNDTPAPTSSNETGLVGYWKMDDYVNGNTTDSSGQGNNGSVIGATYNSGRWNSGYRFDGLNDYISAGNATNINFGANQDFSVSAWINTNTVNYQNIIGRGLVGSGCTLSTSRGYLLSMGVSLSNNLDWKLNTGSAQSCVQITSATNLSKNTWYHVAATADRDGNGVIYLNGVADKTASISAFNSTLETEYPLRIGAYLTATYYPFNGTIDEARIYNRSLSASEVQELYLSKGLVGYWKMDADQKNSTSTFDSSGYYNHGFISGATLTNEGRFKEGYKFDGVDDVITVSNSASFNFSKSNLTICTWVNPKSFINTNPGIVRQNNAFSLDMGSNGYDLRFYVWGPANSASGTGIQSPLNSWTHICGMYNRTEIGLFAQGRLIASTPATAEIASNSNSITLGFGNSRAVNGTIDEVRIYNRALSSTEIGGLYNGTKTNHLLLTKVPG